VGGGARAVVLRRCGGACEVCGLEWPWDLYLFLIDPTGPARAGNLRVLCGPCSADRIGPWAPLLADLSTRERMRLANNRRTGAVKLTASRRRRLIESRGSCCEICGVDESERQLQVHHRLAVLRGGDDSEANLLVLCFACHHQVQPCANGCGHWAKKPFRVCRQCRTHAALAEWTLTAARMTCTDRPGW
jgi:5-methylcytosine-specific restriction endonuclease McrA